MGFAALFSLMLQLHAITKDRSSSYAMNRVCRHTAAYLLASGCKLYLRWFSSEANLADRPLQGVAILDVFSVPESHHVADSASAFCGLIGHQIVHTDSESELRRPAAVEPILVADCAADCGWGPLRLNSGSCDGCHLGSAPHSSLVTSVGWPSARAATFCISWGPSANSRSQESSSEGEEAGVVEGLCQSGEPASIYLPGLAVVEATLSREVLYSCAGSVGLAEREQGGICISGYLR